LPSGNRRSPAEALVVKAHAGLFYARRLQMELYTANDGKTVLTVPLPVNP
jgi:hypothetical protein